MTRRRMRFAAALALGLGGFSLWWAPRTEPTEGAPARARAAAAVQAPRLRELLERWGQAHEARGGDRAIEIGLAAVGAAPQHGGSAAQRRGAARIDALGGRIEVALSAEAGAPGYEVWLVDQRPGPGSSAALEPSDAYLRAGALQPQPDGSLGLRAELGAGAFEQFQVDDVVIARAGAAPHAAPAFRGAPDFFQSLYTSLRTPALFARSDYASPDAFASRRAPLFGPRQALAQSLEELRGFGVPQEARRLLLAVDADAVADELVKMGAQLFIQETFAGNGRTCETCHNLLNNTSLDRSDVALRPDGDALFVSEFMPALAPRRMGKEMRFALDVPTAVREARPCVAADGFPKLDGSPDDPEPVCRAVPHLQAFSQSRTPAAPSLLPQGGQLAGAPLPQFGTLFPGGPLDLPAAGSKPGQLGSQVLADAAGQLGFAIDQSFSVGLRAGFGGDRGVEPSLGLFGDDVGIVIQAVAELFTKTPARDPRSLTPDFRVPTPAEINAITAFYLTLGRQQEPNAERLRFTDPAAERGRLIFSNDGREEVLDRAGLPVAAGKCASCHFNLGSRANPALFDGLCTTTAAQLKQNPAPAKPPVCGGAQLNFETGVENNGSIAESETQLAFGRGLPRDGGYGRARHVDAVCRGGKGGRGAVALLVLEGSGSQPGDCQELFNPPVLVEAADSGPFFHNNTATTLEEAIAFYSSSAFSRSAGGRMLAKLTLTAPGDRPIDLGTGDAQQLAAFLRATNAANNALRARDLVEAARRLRAADTRVQIQLLRTARAELQDAIDALAVGQLNPTVMADLRDLQALLQIPLGTPPRPPLPADLTRIQQGLTQAVRGIVSGFPER